MDTRLVALKLFLDELQIPTDIETVDDRKRVQKAVYLGQLSGIDLGYRFGWYLMGPYSPALTRDYYSLAEAIASGDRDYEDKELQRSVRDRLRTVLPLIEVPQDIALSQEDWLELVSSLHYLRKVRRCSDKEAKDILKEEKPRLFSFADKAEGQLQEVGLLPPTRGQESAEC
jgi:uncharacterized protein YwgA